MRNMPEYRVVRNARVRSLRLKLFPNGALQVVAPRGVGPRAIERFVAQNLDWVARKRGELRERPATALPDSVSLAAIDERWRLAWDAGTFSADAAERLLRIPHARATPAAQECLRQWLLERGRAVLIPWLQRVSGETGLRFARTRIATQKTRWGSCSSRGTISLNARILLLPAHLVDYLLIHELSHTRHMHHGASFWALVEAHCPAYRAAERELDTIGRQLPAWSYFYPLV